MRITFSCPFDCTDEDHETEVHPEYDCGRLGWDGGVELGEILPCGNALTLEHVTHLNQIIYERIIESAHLDP